MEMKAKPAPSNAALKVWFRLLSEFSLNNCLVALDAHTKSSPFAPTPDSLIKSISHSDGRPTAEEAWATALTASDENDTVIWTDEIAEALNLGAGVLLEEGDKTAARMAFRDSYNRCVEQARANSKPINVWVSLGHDSNRRRATIEQAVVKGLLSNDRASELCLDYSGNTEPDNKPFLKLMGDSISEADQTKRIDNLAKLKRLIGR